MHRLKLALSFLALGVIFAGVDIKFGQLRFGWASPASAGVISKTSKAYVSPRLLKSMLLNGTKYGRNSAEKKLFSAVQTIPTYRATRCAW